MRLFLSTFFLFFLMTFGAYSQSVATPTFSVNSLETAIQFSGTASCTTAGATIRYTRSGVDPTENDPTVTSGGALAITRSQTLKLKAFLTGQISRAVQSYTFSITGQVAGGGMPMSLIFARTGRFGAVA